MAVAPDPVPQIVIGLSPFLKDADKDVAYRRIVKLIVDELPLGSSLGVYDAYRLQTVCRVEIPDARAFASRRTRVNQFRGPLLDLKHFLATRQERPVSDGLAFDEAIRLPQFLAFVAENLNRRQDSPTRVLLLGSPLYQDDKEPTFSMVDGSFPSDGHLRASADASVFGLKDRQGCLTNTAVHLGYFSEPWSTGIQQERVTRFWTLFIGLQGGLLETFTGDVPTAFENLQQDSPPGSGRSSHLALDPNQTKIEMIRASREIGTTDWITGDLPNPAQAPPSRLSGPMKIGIRWQGAIDLDLYARPDSEGETLFFQHPRSEAGYYFKDHRTSPDRDYEFIEFTQSVDLRRVEASVNFYAGTAAGGPRGEVRIEFDGRIYSGRFDIASDQGNQGRGGGGQNRFWYGIPVAEILRLNPQSASR